MTEGTTSLLTLLVEAVLDNDILLKVASAPYTIQASVVYTLAVNVLG